jgi:hypothetical protein
MTARSLLLCFLISLCVHQVNAVPITTVPVTVGPDGVAEGDGIPELPEIYGGETIGYRDLPLADLSRNINDAEYIRDGGVVKRSECMVLMVGLTNMG